MKSKALEILSDLSLRDLLKNCQVMGNQVIIDMYASSPTMHEKKRMQQAINAEFQKRLPDAELKLQIENPSKKIDSSLPKIRENAISGIKNIIAIASGKGGVGKSTVSSNLAISLSKMGFSVGLLDADIYGPSIPTMFDVIDEKPTSVKVNGKNKMKPIESYGIKILSIGFFAGVNQAIIWRGPMASKALHQMIHDADWGELDFLLIDLPPGTGDIHLSIVQQVPVTGAVIVSTPQNIALADAKKGVAMFQTDSIQVPVLGIIENMAYFTPKELPNNKYYIFGEGGAKNLAEQMTIPFLGEMPLIQSIREAGDIGRPASLQEESIASKNYIEIAKNVVQSMVNRNKNLPPTEIVRITTMAGCSATKN